MRYFELFEGDHRGTAAMPIQFFHATPAYAYRKIRHNGLVPSSVSHLGEPPGVYLADDIGGAMAYVNMNFGHDRPVRWVILSIESSMLDFERFAPDTGDHEYRTAYDEIMAAGGYTTEQMEAGDVSPWVVMGEIGQIIYRGTIPPKAITVVKTIPATPAARKEYMKHFSR